MSIVDQLDPSGKEIEVGNKKFTQDSKITFNIKAFMSLLIMIGVMFFVTYYFIDKRIDESDDGNSEKIGKLEVLVYQLKDERITSIKEQVDATNGKMELLMMLINSNQIDVSEIRNHTSTPPEEVNVILSPVTPSTLNITED